MPRESEDSLDTRSWNPTTNLQAWGALGEYMTDAMQRTVLFWDLLRQRSEQYYAHKAMVVPHVLRYDFELIVDGRTLERPVNYFLVRVKPPADAVVDARQRPVVVFDPRAGHGPGIGGFKADSELGVAMQTGHPCYFVGFSPEPMPGQTIEDIAHAEALFLENVIALHPKAEGKPCVIGNCQAGWAVMLVAAMRPELFGPLIIAGAPLSYWAGVEGENPMRYTGGLTGGSWITALTSDLGGGKFDGANLVSNFENLNPSNTLWTKHYDVWSKVDTEGPRFLEFEKWWGGHVNLNAEEMQWIVDELFVGNRLATGEILFRDGARIDLRNIRSPIVCFCSKGDNITPPQQALGWIVDLYGSDDDVRASGQTIIYRVHEDVGHLGIFVSGGVARKEHREFVSNIDLIDVLPPGLYEAVLTPIAADTVNPALAAGDWVARFEPRTLDDVRAIVQPDPDNELRFAAVRRVSEINLGLYRTLFQPFVRACATGRYAEWLKRMKFAELPFALFSDQNPFMRRLPKLAEAVRRHRQPVSEGNPLRQWEGEISDGIVAALDAYRDLRDRSLEQMFLATYGSSILQTMTGLKSPDELPRKRPGTAPERRAFIAQRVLELKKQLAVGGTREAVIRALVYIGMEGSGVDERAFNQLRRIRRENRSISLQQFKQILREQYFGLLLDPEGALAAIPQMLVSDKADRGRVLEVIRKVVTADGGAVGAKAARLAMIERLVRGGEAQSEPEGDPPRVTARRRRARATGG